MRDPYFDSERFLTEDYWVAKWKARQYWYQKDSEFEERTRLKIELLSNSSEKEK